MITKLVEQCDIQVHMSETQRYFMNVYIQQIYDELYLSWLQCTHFNGERNEMYGKMLIQEKNQDSLKTSKWKISGTNGLPIDY